MDPPRNWFNPQTTTTIRAITATINITLRTFQGEGRPRYRLPLDGGETREAAGRAAVSRVFSSTRTVVEEFFVMDTILLQF